MSKQSHLFREVPERWLVIAEAEKTVATWAEWSVPKSLRSGQRTVLMRGQLSTVAAEETTALFALAGSGIGHDGVRLRIVAWAYRRQDDVTATLEVVAGTSWITIARLDAWPPDGHRNAWWIRKALGLEAIAAEVDGSHVHRFEVNAKLGREAFDPGPDGNLPIAAELPDALVSFRDFLRAIGTEFRIDGLEGFPPPEGWSRII